MSLIKKVTTALIALGVLGCMNIAEAKCWRYDKFQTVKINMDLGRVVIPPDAVVGQVIASKVYKMPAGTVDNYHCSESSYIDLTASLINPGPEVMDHVYATNIPGIGMRLTRDGGKIHIVYPGTFHAGPSTRFTLVGSTFTLELIKTAPVTGSGVIESRQYTAYSGPDGKSVLSTYVSGNGITIVSPSCKFLSNRIMNIDFPAVSLGNFKGTGSTVGDKQFSIDLQCNGGTSISGYANVNTSFSGNQPVGYDKSTGVLVNEDTSGSSAKGIGFVVKTGGKPVKFDNKYFIEQLKDNVDTKVSFPLSASYYQYDNDVSAGHVTSHMTYNITYD